MDENKKIPLKFSKLEPEQMKLLLTAFDFDLDDLKCKYCGVKTTYDKCAIMPPLNNGKKHVILCDSPVCMCDYLDDDENSPINCGMCGQELKENEIKTHKCNKFKKALYKKYSFILLLVFIGIQFLIILIPTTLKLICIFSMLLFLDPIQKYIDLLAR